MAVTNTHPKGFVLGLYKAVHNFNAGHTFKVALMKTSYAFNASTHSTLAAAIAGSKEIAATGGYARKTIGSVAVALDSSGSTLVTGGNVTWTASTSAMVATGAAIIYNDTAASDPVVACIDFGASYTTPAGATFQINFTSGLFKGTPI